jgi:hypothetical protein
MIQRNGVFAGPMLAEERRRRARLRYESFINSADQYGLPVRFLRHVARRYTIRVGFSDEVSTIFNEMTLEEETLRGVESMAPAAPYGEASGIRTIYEESVHAYLDLMEDDPRWREFIAAGERHYRGAPVSRSRVTSDSARVFNEAAANYAAHRVASWWSAFENLSIYTAMSASDPTRARRIREARMFERIRNDYDRAMREVVFGYSEEGGFLGIGAEQAETTRPVSRDMKAFLDREILEGKIPDRFDQVTGFRRLLGEAGVQLSQPNPQQQQIHRKTSLKLTTNNNLDVEASAERYPPHWRGTGQPLDAGTRTLFEAHFGCDFSEVRVHTNASAAESARTINALAYTVGRDMVFGTGQYAPETSEGRRLIAHELAHVVQQVGWRARGSWLTSEYAMEQEAQAAAFNVMTGSRLHVGLRAPGATIQYAVQPTAQQTADAQRVRGTLQSAMALLQTVGQHLVTPAQRESLAEILTFLATFVPNGLGTLDQNGARLASGARHSFFYSFRRPDQAVSMPFELQVRFDLSYEPGGEADGRYRPGGTHLGSLTLYIPKIKDATADDLAALVIHEAVHVMFHLRQSVEAHFGAEAGRHIPGIQAATILDTGTFASHRQAFRTHFATIIGFLNQQSHHHLLRIQASRASEWADRWLEEVIAYTYESRVRTGIAKQQALSQPGPQGYFHAPVEPVGLIYRYLIRHWLDDPADQAALRTSQGDALMQAMRPALTALQQAVEARVGPAAVGP